MNYKTRKTVAIATAVVLATGISGATYAGLNASDAPKPNPVVQVDEDKPVEEETTTSDTHTAKKDKKADKPSTDTKSESVVVTDNYKAPKEEAPVVEVEEAVVAETETQTDEPSPSPSPTETEDLTDAPKDLPEIVVNTCGIDKIRPERIIIACGDGNIFIEDIEWVEWTQDHARGNGYMMMNDCDPNCAAGTFDRKMTTVWLEAPFEGKFQTLNTHDGEYLYQWDAANTMKY